MLGNFGHAKLISIFSLSTLLKDLHMRKIIYLSFLAIMAFSACKKSPSTQLTTFDLTRDSIYYYTKEDYYWSDAIPDYNTFSPRSFQSTDDISSLQGEVDALSQYKINPLTNLPYEYYTPDPGEAKYSFVDDGSTATILNGTRGDFGFALSYYLTSTNLRVRYVYPGSPAGLAGMRRGDQVTGINSISSLDASVNANYNAIVSALQSSTITIKLTHSDGTTATVNLSTASYTVNPVITYKVFDQGNGKKAGYVVFNSFTSLENAQPKLTEAFNYFVSNGVTDLVVDLRYNGGGYVETAEYLSNLIVPSAKTGTLMYNTYYNALLASGKSALLVNQVRRDPTTSKLYNYAQLNFTVAGNVVNFAKQGSLNISRVFFIVTGATASASELTINNLRPELNVQLIGQTSYGKPVGFFDIDIDKYTLYTPEFETKNSANQGGYYTGMTPGSADYPGLSDTDDLTKDFGDPTEGLLKHALDYVKNGTYSTPNIQVQSLETNSAGVRQADLWSRQLDHNRFNGMLFRNLKRK